MVSSSLLVDLGLIWLLWRRILSGWESRISLAWTVAGAALTGCALLFSLLVVTFGEAGVPVSLHDWVYRSLVDDSTPRSRSFFSDTLVLSGSNIYESLGIDDPEKVKWRDYTFSAHSRDLRGAAFDLANLPKVDFTGADLQDASFIQAQLQMASFDGAKLQGANLQGAKLQGASLLSALLQGASLDLAQLQGSLLDYAQLQGAKLDSANLQGAALNNVMLQGASLQGAQLQGATLQEALLQATDLSDSLLWRTNSTTPSFFAPTATRLPDTTKSPWGPLFWATSSNERLPWDENSYNKLRKMLDALPSATRIEALKRINRLDCSSPDSTLTPCASGAGLSLEDGAWQKTLEESRVDAVAYSQALASVLRTEVCVGLGIRGGVFAGGRAELLLDYAFVENNHFILRGLMASTLLGSRLEGAGLEAPDLIDFIMGGHCPVSASLTNAEKARLLQIKQDAIEKRGHP